MSFNNKDFGWFSAFKDYSFCSVLGDCVFPLITSLLSLSILLFLNIDIYKALLSILNLSIAVVPTMLSLLLAGYAILLSLYWSDFGLKIKKMNGGVELLNQINASFAIAILVMILGVFVCLFSLFVCNLEVKSLACLNENMINGTVFFFVVFLLAFSIWIMKDITINIFNLGKASLKMPE